ncbi:MAG: hypothetical protein JO197_18255 [Acidobacteria bacterium]|nr:hypothetical protein [Acidobacteriota bacterium]MBV9479047.1 hypothetical protein [Acidobacteriota bacterium]
MPEPEHQDDTVERRVVHETVSVSSSRQSAITMIIIVVVAIALIAWVISQMR